MSSTSINKSINTKKINNRKKIKKFTSMWILSKTLLNTEGSKKSQGKLEYIL